MIRNIPIYNNVKFPRSILQSSRQNWSRSTRMANPASIASNFVYYHSRQSRIGDNKRGGGKSWPGVERRGGTCSRRRTRKKNTGGWLGDRERGWEGSWSGGDRRRRRVGEGEIDRIFRAIGAAYRQPISAPHSNNRLARVTTCRLGILQLLLERNKDLLMPLERHTQIYTHTTALSLHTFTLSLQFSRWTFSLNARNAHSITGDSWHRHRYPDRVLFLVSSLPSPPLPNTLSMKPSLLGHGYIDIPTSSSYSVSLSLFLLYISFFFYYYVESTVIPTSMHFLSRFSNFSVDADSNTVISMLRRVCTVYIWWKKVSRDGWRTRGARSYPHFVTLCWQTWHHI